MEFKTEYDDHEVTVHVTGYSAGCDTVITGSGYGDCDQGEPEYIDFILMDASGGFIADERTVSRDDYFRIMAEAKMEMGL